MEYVLYPIRKTGNLGLYLVDMSAIGIIPKLSITPIVTRMGEKQILL